MVTGADRRIDAAEREAAAGQLREHYATGRLTMDEFRARLDAAYSAETPGELSRVTADLPMAGPDAVTGAAARDTGRRHHPARLAALLVVVGLVTAIALALSSLPHGTLLVLAFLLVVLPVMLLTALAGALVWIGRRAWRSGAWLEVVPFAVGAPWLGRVIWLARAALVGRAFWQAGQRAGLPLRSRRDRGRYRGVGYAEYQASPDGPWHQARVGDLSGTTR
jgi:hypothetical protein